MLWPGQDTREEVEDHELNRGPYVDTVIETGQRSSREPTDASKITIEQAVEQEMCTGT